MQSKKLLLSFGLALLGLLPVVARAQFSAGLQGSVQDPSGAGISDAAVTLTNTATRITQAVHADKSGNYRFVSLAPGEYTVQATATGFNETKVPFTLSTDQLMNVPIRLSASGGQQVVEVTDKPPVLDTAETRTELTLDQEAMDSLPLPGRNQLNLVTLAPGVTGLGTQSGGGNSQSTDNYASETAVSASANGRSSVGNMYVVDGLDITSDITPGVLNLVPNPDTIQEATVQVNTFTVEYGRSSSIVEVMTTRSGADKYHFLASDYYSANWLNARTEFQNSAGFKFLPYHSNNLSASLSGPVPFVKKLYFFTGWEPLLSSTLASSQITYEDPQFVAWAQQNWPNSLGVKLLAQFPPSNALTTGVAQNGSAVFYNSSTKTSTCGTAAAANVPCNLPVIDNGVLNATNYRNGLQWNARIDKVFDRDRVYGNYYRTTLDTGGPSVRVGHTASQHYSVNSAQFNETHTFNDHILNEAAFGYLRMEGLINPTGPFHLPIISVSKAWSTGLGVSKAHEDYVQHHWIWKDALSWVHGRHQFQFGYQGFRGDNLTYFGQWDSQPNFGFTDLASFLQDQVYTETGVSYNLLTGQPAGLAGGSFQIIGNSFGVYAQDVWKLNNRLTLTYGLRWDDFGNPSPQNGSIAANFFYGQGSTIQDQVTSGYVKQVSHAFNHSLTAWSPRIGAAFDPTGSAKWLIRGGFGLYHDWITLGNVQNEFGNPPASAGVTFQSNTAGLQPIYNVGNSDTWPFGFTYPSFAGYTLNSQGGITGQQVNVAGNDPDLHPSNTMNYTVTLERGITRDYSVAVGYSGSHSNNLFTDFAGHTTNAYYGVDINNFPGSLIQNNGKLVRLNTSFGTIRYTVNGPTSTYNAFIAAFKGRFLHQGFVDVSYTRSRSYDDAGTYPTVQSNIGSYSQYWAPSYWDAPNRLSMAVSYELPKLKRGPEVLHILTNGWKPSAVTVLQSGTPFTVLNTASYSQGGDYNADGTNSDLPNVPTYGYKIPTDRNHQLGRNADFTPIPATTNGAPTPGATGVFNLLSDFTAPAGYKTTPVEGNEVINGYRNPGYANTDFAILKNTSLHELGNLQLRLEVFNVFNRANLTGINGSMTSSSFGKATSQYNPRFLQIGARYEF